VFTYVDYDFRNQKWTTPLVPEDFGVRSAESFCKSAMSHAADALETVMKRISTQHTQKKRPKISGNSSLNGSS